jgi:hypothetical protein
MRKKELLMVWRVVLVSNDRRFARMLKLAILQYALPSQVMVKANICLSQQTRMNVFP